MDADADEAADQAAKTRAEDVVKLAKGRKRILPNWPKPIRKALPKIRAGYLGKFQQSQMVKPFADKAFSMAAGEISDPVKTQFGCMSSRWSPWKMPRRRPLDQSRDQIVAAITERKARNLAYDKAETFYEGCFEKDDFVKNAKTFQLAIMETGAFSRKGPDELGRDKGAFANAAFALKVDEISDIQDIGDRYYLLQITESIDSVIPNLADVEARVKVDLTRKMKTEKANAEAEAMATDLRDGKAFGEIADQRGIMVKHTGLFMRNTAIPDIGSDPKFTEAAFQLSSAGSTSQHPVKGIAGFYLMRLAERKAPEADGFEDQKEGISQYAPQTEAENRISGLDRFKKSRQPDHH